MVDAPDAGPIVAQEAVAIGPNDDALAVSMAVAAAAARVLTAALPGMAAGPPPGRPMDLAAGSYFGGRRPEDGRIQPDWPGLRVHAMIRAVAPPFPGAFIEAERAGVWCSPARRFTGERPGIRRLAPCLYATDGAAVHGLPGWYPTADRQPCSSMAPALDGREFQERFGTQPWRFNFTASD